MNGRRNLSHARHVRHRYVLIDLVEWRLVFARTLKQRWGRREMPAKCQALAPEPPCMHVIGPKCVAGKRHEGGWRGWGIKSSRDGACLIIHHAMIELL